MRKPDSKEVSAGNSAEALHDVQAKAVENYHQELAALCTEGCLEDIMINRILLSFGKLLAQQKAGYAIDQVILSGNSNREGDPQDFDFALSLKSTVNSEDTLKVKGQISLYEGRVSHFYYGPIQGLTP